MPRKSLIRSKRFPYHVVNRVNNRDWFPMEMPSVWEFFEEECYGISLLFHARIHAFVLMSNHFHMLVSTPAEDLGEIMRYFLSSITRSMNAKTGRKGHLFIGRYKWSLIDSPQYFHHPLKYVYRNPVKAGICSRTEEYQFSTLHGLLGQSPLVIPTVPLHESLGGFFPSIDARGFLDWLNTPSLAEYEDSIRKALRRRVFELPMDRETRTPLDLSHASFLGAGLRQAA